MKVNFKQFDVYTSLKGDQRQTTDAREAVADAVYMAGIGVFAHSLALRILQSEGEIELTAREEQIVEHALAEKGRSFVYGSFLRLKEGEEEKNRPSSRTDG